jgi:glycosyltransferase involved in cell wall biosynthesis
MIERYSFGNSPYITVVVPTIPSNSHEEVLDCLKNQEIQEDYEVVIVNDHDLDICEARNKGIDEARGEIVALTDDDCVPPSDWVKNIGESYKFHDSIACIEGAVSGGLNYSGTRHYVGCNLTFKRSETLEIGGFCSEYAGFRDDTEFGWRMEDQADDYCIFDESIRMVHPERPRSNYNHSLNSKFKSEYPKKYEEVFNRDIIERMYMTLARIGIIGLFNRVYNRVSG